VGKPQELGDRPTWVRYQVLGSLCLLAIINYIHRNGFANATYIKSDLGLSDQQWSTVTAAFLVAYAGFEVPWGILGDRVGARHLLAVATLGWSGMTAALAFLKVPDFIGNQFHLLLGLRFLFGLFQAAAFPSISRVMADWMPIDERATAQGMIWMCSRIGGAVAPFLLGPKMAQVTNGLTGGNWGYLLILVSLLGVVWCVAVWPWFRNKPEENPRVNALERERIVRHRQARVAGHGAIPWSVFLISRNVWALCFMYGFGGFSATFFVTLLPAYLKGHRAYSDLQVQWLSGLPLAFGVLACLAGGVISDSIIRRTDNKKWGRRICGLIGQGGAGLALVSTNWASEVWVLGALLCLTFFFNDLAMGPAWASCADIGERYAGTLGGAMNTIGNMGGALGNLVTGYLMGKMYHISWPITIDALPGNTLVFVILGCSFWLGASCWFVVDVTKPISVQQ
jgi:MFS transporter, ACS family, glucarate transporter